jgi:hypothetical protein
LEFLSMAQTSREARRLLYWWENRHTHGSVRLKRIKRIKKRLGDRLPRFSELGVIPDNRSTLVQSLLIRSCHTSTTLCGRCVAEVWRGCGPTLGTLW